MWGSNTLILTNLDVGFCVAPSFTLRKRRCWRELAVRTDALHIDDHIGGIRLSAARIADMGQFA